MKKSFDRQKRYGTLRGYMMARGMAVIEDDGSVTINVNPNSAPTINGGGSSGSEDQGGGSGSDNQGGGSGTDDTGGGSDVEPEF